MDMKLNPNNRYEEFTGKEVRVITPNNSFIGVLQPTNYLEVDINLMPSIVSINLPEAKGRWSEDYAINLKIPTKIRKDLVGIVQAVPEGYMNEILNKTNYYNNQKTKLSFKSKVRSIYRIIRNK